MAQYKVVNVYAGDDISVEAAAEEKLNELAKEGWRLVCASHTVHRNQELSYLYLIKTDKD